MEVSRHALAILSGAVMSFIVSAADGVSWPGNLAEWGIMVNFAVEFILTTSYAL